MYLPVPKFTPTSDRVLVRKIEADKSRGGVLMPPSQKMMFEQGVVVAIGPGKRYDNGELIPVAFKEGDTVLYSGGSAADLRMESGETLWLMTESAILGVVSLQQESIVSAAATLPKNIVSAAVADISNVPERTSDVTDKLIFETED